MARRRRKRGMQGQGVLGLALVGAAAVGLATRPQAVGDGIPPEPPPAELPLEPPGTISTVKSRYEVVVI